MKVVRQWHYSAMSPDIVQSSISWRFIQSYKLKKVDLHGADAGVTAIYCYMPINCV